MAAGRINLEFAHLNVHTFKKKQNKTKQNKTKQNKKQQPKRLHWHESEGLTLRKRIWHFNILLKLSRTRCRCCKLDITPNTT